MTSGAVEGNGPNRPRNALPLFALFGTIYLVQGLIEPATGIVSEPVESLLKNWGDTPFQVSRVLAFIGLPWCLKPLFGLLSDFWPLWGSRRRVYLIPATVLATVTYFALATIHLTRGEQPWITWLLFITTMAVACADVVLDAHMIESTQPMGLTSRAQSVQYGAAYMGAIIAAVLGGILTEEHRPGIVFLLCGALMAGQLLIVWFGVKEVVTESVDRAPVGYSIGNALCQAMRSRAFLAVAGMAAVYHLNPFSQAVVYLHFTGPLQVDEDAYGLILAWSAAGGLMATLFYGAAVERWTMQQRIYVGLVGGILSNLIYFAAIGPHGLHMISFVVGFCYLLGGLVLLDLSARVCPRDATGTVYATLMSLCNLCGAIGTLWGGGIYSYVSERGGPQAGFHAIIVSGALVTVACLLFVPILPWHQLHQDGRWID